MPLIEFTSQLAQHVECPPDQHVGGATLREALEQLFAQHPRLQAYVMDDQGMLRSHIAVFVDGNMLEDRDGLDVPLTERSEVFLMQAISGG